MRIRSTPSAGMGLVLLVALSPCAAQDFSPAIDPGIVAGIAAQRATQMQAERMARGRAIAPIGSLAGSAVIGGGLADVLAFTTSGTAAPATNSSARLAYTPTPALRQRAVSGYLERIGQRDREAARVMQNVLSRQNWSALYDGMIRDTPLRPDDAIDAVVVYTMIGWQIANRDAGEISNSKVSAIRAQMAPALAGNSTLASPENRAALGEEMKLLALTLHGGWLSAVKEGTARQYSDGVARMWQNQTGRDLRAVKLTDAGFSRR